MGLPWSTLLTLAGVVGSLVVGLYILKLRRRPIPVPFSRIWQRVLRDKEATTLFAHLKRLWSLLLQLALLALLLAALGDPRPSVDTTTGRSLIVLIDASASMQATDVSPYRLAQAQREALQIIRGLSGTDRMLIAQMDANVTPLSTMTGDVPALEAALDRVQASDTRADLRRALRFALDSLRDTKHPEIILVSDGALGDVEEQVRGLDLSHVELRFVPVGLAGKNVGLTGFSVRRYPLDKSRAEVMLEVTNTNSEPTEVELQLLGDGQLIDVSRFSLGPRERLPRFITDLSGASRTLEARLSLGDGRRDDLPADDRAYALMPERRRARILVVTPGNTYLEAALLLDEYLDVMLVNPAEYPPPGNFDVTILDRVAPALAPGSGSVLYLAPPAARSPVGHGRAIRMFGFDQWDKKSPVLRWMAMADIQVAEGHTLAPAPGDQVLGASDHGPILVAGRRAGKRFIVLGFDPRQSDLVLRVAWPLFILNAIGDFVEEDTGYLSSYRTGRVWHVPAANGVKTAMLRDPRGRERTVPVQDGHAVYFGERAGFYQLSVTTDGQTVRSGFAANLVEPEEGHIAPQSELRFGGRKASAPTGFVAGVRRELWILLLLAGLLVSAFEWFTYHRRWTV
ncbi:VWA domain-containing protein [Myxococcota bacterium]